MASIEERVESLVEKKINDLGYELYDVEYAKACKEVLEILKAIEE